MTAAGEFGVSYWLDSDPVQVSRAREHARKMLPGWGLGEHTDVAELIVSELVTNATVHGAGQIEVRLSCATGGDLWAEVHDDGAGLPVRQRPGAGDERGRGLELIDGLIELYGGAMGVVEDSNGPGKTVYVAVSLGCGPVSRLRPRGHPVTAATESAADKRELAAAIDAPIPGGGPGEPATAGLRPAKAAHRPSAPTYAGARCLR